MIYYPKIYGTCIGAKKAIDTAIKVKNENKDKNVYIYKEILHNSYVVNDLKDKGIYIIDDLDKISSDDILIIRAHGEPKSTYDYLEKKHIKYYDATCVNVKRIHDLVSDKDNVIIVGKKEHPEVIGTAGHVENSIIIETEDDYKQIDKNKKYFVVSQTTVSPNKTENLIKYLKDNIIEYTKENTICSYQKMIQTSSVDLAKEMDAMIVIGGKNSSNTKELFNECSKVCTSYFFSELDEFYEFIKTGKLKPDMKIGFTGGASTMQEQVMEYSNLLEFYLYYAQTKKKIETEIKKFNSIIDGKNDNKIVKKALDKFTTMNFDGKCVRGTLIDLGYRSLINDDKAIPLSASYEAFETSILIHDDIIDNSPLRRGKKTIHELYKDEFKGMNIDNTPTSLALCLGDIGFFYINNYIINNYKDNKNVLDVIKCYSDIVINTVKGEILDVYLPFVERNDKNHKLTEEDIMEIYKLKTSMYTIVGPFSLGMILAGAKNKDIEEAKKILMPLGIAFQIKDDILGIFSNEDVIGKSNVSDIEEFKQTILYSYIKVNKNEFLEPLLKIYGKKNITNSDYEKVKEILIDSGSLEYANSKMNELFNEAKSLLRESNMKDSIKSILFGFIEYLYLRQK